jgi:hypothetical protein
MAYPSRAILKGIFGAAVLSLTFGAVASGRDLIPQNAANPLDPAGTSATINRAAKADRPAHVASSARQSQTVAMRLNDLANTSVLIRIPLASQARSGAPAALTAKSGQTGPTGACEPVVSVLTEVAKRLQPGRCVT